MGQSTNAILFWGYCWDRENQKPWMKEHDESVEDFETYEARAEQDDDARYASAMGLREPAEPYSEETKEAYRGYYAQRQDLANAAPCAIVRHCMSECPMYGVAVKASLLVAYRGGPVEVDPAKMQASPEWRTELARYCELMGIDPEGMEPRWWLVSWWS